MISHIDIQSFKYFSLKNYFFLKLFSARSIQKNKPEMVDSNTTGTNTVATGDTKYLTFNDPKLVPYLMKYGGNGDGQRERQLELEREQQLEQKRKQRGRKQNAKHKGNIIRPQEEPGYVGDKEVDDIMKTMGFEQSSPPIEQKAQQKANGRPSNGTDSNSAKKSASTSVKQMKKK